MTFEERLAAVEAALKANQIPATLAQLQRKLEATWQPDAGVLLEPGSVSEDALADDAVSEAKVSAWSITGDLTVTWPAAGIFSNAESLTHGLGRVPLIIIPVLVSTTVLTAFPSWPRVFNYAATTCSVQMNTVDGQVPGVTATATIRLIGIG